MQNEFEKRVQQKLEELDLVPSAPVWTNIEAQIREKKERRRILFWLPVLLLIGGGLWWALGRTPETAGQDARPETSVAATPGHPAAASPVLPGGSTPMGGAVPPTGSATGPALPPASEPTPVSSETPKVNPGTKAGLGASRPDAGAATITASAPTTSSPFHQTSNGRASVRTHRAGITGSPSGQTPGPNRSAYRQRQPTERPAPSVSTVTEPLSLTTATEYQPRQQPAPSATITTTAPSESAKDSVVTVPAFKADSATLKPKTEKKKLIARILPKWQLGLTASAGSSRQARSLALFGGGAKSFDLMSSPLPANGASGNPIYSGTTNLPDPSAPRPGSFVSLGAIAKKSLGPKLLLAIGLEWGYYSTLQDVGKRTDSSSRLNTYVNAANSNGYNKSSYRNSFHFLSVPVSLEWQPLNRVPVVMKGGLSVQQLLFTNALSYSEWGQFFYYKPSAFTKTQLFTRAGVEARFRIAGHRVQAGPELQYGLASMREDARGNHLLSYGMRVQWLFKK